MILVDLNQADEALTPCFQPMSASHMPGCVFASQLVPVRLCYMLALASLSGDILELTFGASFHLQTACTAQDLGLKKLPVYHQEFKATPNADQS